MIRGSMPWPGQTYNAVRQLTTQQLYNESSLDVTGRVGGTQFYASGSNLTQEGAIRFLQGFQRNTFRLNVDQVVGTNFNLAFRSQYTRSTQDGINQENGGNAFFVLTRVPGIVNVLQRDTLGRLYIRTNLQQGGSQNANPLYQLENTDRSDITNRFLGGLTLQYRPVSWMNVEGTFSYDIRRTATLQFQDKGYRTTSNTPGTNNGSVFRAASGVESMNGGVNAGLQHNFSTDLIGHLNLRYAYEQRRVDTASASGNFLGVAGVTSLDNAQASTRNIGSTFEDVRQIGLFSGVGLEYKERYIFDALIRRDGSSLYGPANRWATFGRVSGAWRVARERWWFIPQIDELKLRATYGTAGRGPRFSAQYETMALVAGNPTFSQLGNKNLQPELSKELELGVDAEMLNRYGLTVTYARANIDRQLLQVPVSAGTGFVNQWQNAGTLQNTTWELSLNLPLVQRRDVSWSLRFIYDRTRSVITKMDIPPYFDGPPQQGAGSMFRYAAGERFGTIYGRYFLRNCAELPAPYNGDCGFSGASFQRNDEGWIVWVGAGNRPTEGITKNLWETQLPATSAPWGVALNWGMPIILRGDPLNATSARQVALGNALPNFHFAISQDVTWRRFSMYALLDAAIGQ